MFLRASYDAVSNTGTEFAVTIELRNDHDRPRPVIEFFFSFRGGFMGNGGRRERREATDEVIATAKAAFAGKMPREIFADSLTELGVDDGITNCVRGRMGF